MCVCVCVCIQLCVYVCVCVLAYKSLLYTYIMKNNPGTVTIIYFICFQTKSGSELVISVNLLQHDLRVGGVGSPLETSPCAGRGGRSHSRTPVNGNGSVNGDTLSFPRRTLTTNFKNPEYTV